VRLNVTTALACATVLVAGLAGCGKDRTGGPRGTPVAVVSASPGDTLKAGRASVQAATSTANSDGWVDFAHRQVHVTVAGRGASAAPALLRDPLLAVEVVRGAVDVVEYGGAEVRGASTIRYEFDVDPNRAALGPAANGLRRPTFYADAWIDSQGRLRQVLVPANLNEARPGTNSSATPEVVTVQFFDFKQEAR